MKAIVRIAAVAAAVAALVPAGAGAGSATADIQFEKTFDPVATVANGMPTWTGPASGDAVGTVQSRLRSFEEVGGITRLEAEWVVSAGAHSFTARLTGIFNPNSRIIVLNGIVTEGWMAGAQIHERGVRPDLSVSRYVGTLTLVGGGSS